MSSLDDAVRAFLSLERIAVAGVSRDAGGVGNLIYRKLRATGHRVFAVNPNATEVEGDACYPDVKSVPGGVQAVVVTTRPEAVPSVVRDAAEAGASWIWMHRAIGAGSVSEEAARFCSERGIHVIAGACPMMYLAPVDVPHKCFRWVLKITGGLPKPR